MTHEPGRERHMIHKCKKCRCIVSAGELYHNKEYDEYWCEACINGSDSGFIKDEPMTPLDWFERYVW